MNGRAESTERTGSHSGRHRRGEGTWTPSVPARPSSGRHWVRTEPVDPPVSGFLTGFLPVMSPGQAIDPGYPPARGELPLSPRTTVTLAPPDRVDTAAEEPGILDAPTTETGLGTFDLGSIPASVTPPRSWRKAAWFATASSGGVVVALLVAGSALVGKSAPDQAGAGWVHGLGGGEPTIGGGQIGTDHGQAATDGEARAAERITGTPSPSSPVRSPAEPRAPVTGGGHGTSGSAAVSSRERPTEPPAPLDLDKPPSTPAPYDADAPQLAFSAGNPATLAEDSQTFLETVTDNPEGAYEMTTGELRQEGTSGLERKYAAIAYFQVRHISVHQYEGKTVCTVQTVYKDGTRTTEQRVLTFAHGKISNAG